MKIKHLINSFSAEEIEEIQFALRQDQKEDYLFLLDQLKKEETPDKKQLFESLHKRPYSKKEDYLIRNKVSGLSKYLEHQLAKTQTDALLQKEDHHFQMAVLRSLLVRHAFELFEKTLKQYLRTAKNQQQHQHIADLILLYVEFRRAHQEVKPKEFLPIRDLLAEAFQQHQFAERERRYQFTRELWFTNWVLMRAFPEKKAQYLEEIKAPEQIAPPTPLPPHLRYLELLHQSYYQSGEEKIATLQTLISLHPNCIRHPDEESRLFLRLHAMIGLEYFLLRRFPEADQYYGEVLLQMERKRELLQMDVLFNISSNLLALDQFKRMVKLFERYEKEILQSPVVEFVFWFNTALAHLFLQNTDAAHNLLPQDLQQRGLSEQFYGRIIYAFIYYQWEDLELCERELTNILQKIRYKKPPTPDYLPTVRLFRELVQIRFAALDRAGFQLKMENLIKKIESASQKLQYNIMLLKLLRHKAQKLQTSAL